MSRKKKEEAEAPEGWESLAEEASGGSLSPSAELEEALREAADAVDQASEPAAPAGSEPGEDGEQAPEGLVLELKQSQDRLLRLHADFENFRRRALKERTEAHQYGHQNLVKDLLPAVDNLDRAIDHARESGDGDLEGLLQGVEAMAQRPDGSVAPNTVIEELQKGYQLRDRLLRPTRVIVSRAPEDADGAGNGGEGGASD
jgi:molecular chaperone GrpE